eukprot:GFKZ01011105.1.p4 GENE.GFKZ01011105.1~~GFKZ01011105.1.p4  ORF type:complete len:115 (+),score=4.04 GFKZ01011105.1:2064-2408(+)
MEEHSQNHSKHTFEPTCLIGNASRRPDLLVEAQLSRREKFNHRLAVDAILTCPHAHIATQRPAESASALLAFLGYTKEDKRNAFLSSQTRRRFFPLAASKGGVLRPHLHVFIDR